MSLKILYIATGLNRGGAETMLYNLLSKINRDRFMPVVISLMNHGDLGKQIEDLNIPVYSTNIQPGIPSLQKIIGLIEIINQEQPDLIQGWMYQGNLVAQLSNIIRVKNIPVVWSIHHSLYDIARESKRTQFIIKAGKILAPFARKITYVSRQSKSEHEKLGYIDAHSSIMPNGFDVNLFRPRPEIKIKLRAELEIVEDSFLIGSLARFHPMKDHENLLRAAAILLPQYPQVHLVLVGSEITLDNPLLKKLVTELNIKERVHFLGERTDVPEITPGLDILTTSSAFGEAFPMVIGEAMACGIPCVATDVGDTAWVIQHTGKVVPPRNPEALANGWRELLELSAVERKKLGELARERIIANFSLNSVVGRYEELYEEVGNR